MTKFHKNRAKIVDFLLIVTFLAIPKFARTPSRFLAMVDAMTLPIIKNVAMMVVTAALKTLVTITVPHASVFWPTLVTH